LVRRTQFRFPLNALRALGTVRRDQRIERVTPFLVPSEANGVIDRYVAIANAQKLGSGLNMFISISLKEQSKHALAAFEERIAEHDEVMECYLMAGDSDYLIRVVIADIQALEKFILEQLTPIPGIEKIRTSFTLKQVRYKTALPLGLLR
jgi:Lrp/AsnC family transcriptional regulator, leucine-responsive regulatory protein